MGRISSPATTNYMQDWAYWNLLPNAPYSTTVYLVTGTAEEIRAAVYSLEGH